MSRAGSRLARQLRCGRTGDESDVSQAGFAPPLREGPSGSAALHEVRKTRDRGDAMIDEGDRRGRGPGRAARDHLTRLRLAARHAEHLYPGPLGRLVAHELHGVRGAAITGCTRAGWPSRSSARSWTARHPAAGGRGGSDRVKSVRVGAPHAESPEPPSVRHRWSGRANGARRTVGGARRVRTAGRRRQGFGRARRVWWSAAVSSRQHPTPAPPRKASTRGICRFPARPRTRPSRAARHRHSRSRSRPDGPVSVGSLLRREGRRAAHALDRPLVPRARDLLDPDGRATTHGVAVAAGALLAVTAVLGSNAVGDPAILSGIGVDDAADSGPAAPSAVPAPAQPPSPATAVAGRRRVGGAGGGGAAGGRWSGAGRPVRRAARAGRRRLGRRDRRRGPGRAARLGGCHGRRCGVGRRRGSRLRHARPGGQRRRRRPIRRTNPTDGDRRSSSSRTGGESDRDPTPIRRATPTAIPAADRTDGMTADTDYRLRRPAEHGRRVVRIRHGVRDTVRRGLRRVGGRGHRRRPGRRHQATRGAGARTPPASSRPGPRTPGQDTDSDTDTGPDTDPDTGGNTDTA